MPLRSWTTPPGRISLANIQAEFGGSNPIRMREYYAGNLYVTANTQGTPNGISTSIPTWGNRISIKNFFGANAGGNVTTTTTTTTTAAPGNTTTTTTTTTSTTTTTTTTTTSSGTVSLSAIDNNNYAHSAFDPGASNVYLRFFSNGAFNVRNITGTIMDSGNWHTPISANIGASYWIKWEAINVSKTSGADIAANSAGYVTLASFGFPSTPSQQMYSSTPGSALESASVTYWIRIASNSSGTTVLASANVTLDSSTTL